MKGRVFVPDRESRTRLHDLASMIYAALETWDEGTAASRWLNKLLAEVNIILQLLRAAPASDSRLDGINEVQEEPAESVRGRFSEHLTRLMLIEKEAPDFTQIQPIKEVFYLTLHELSVRSERVVEHRPALPYSQPWRGNEAETADHRGLILAVDDDVNNRDLLSRSLTRDGYDVLVAGSGLQALRMVRDHSVDLILLDLIMPGMDGLSVLLALKKDSELRSIPVLVISAHDRIEHAIACIQQGAEDYIPKPFNRTLLRTRVHALLERKLLRDKEAKRTRDLELALVEIYKERRRTEELLLNILPSKIANELRVRGLVQPTSYEDATIVFADFVQFTKSTELLSASELVRQIDLYFSAFDEVIARYGLEKLKTIGDCYMYVAGVPERTLSHAVDSVLAGLELLWTGKQLIVKGALPLEMRVGIHSGPVVAGVVGKRKFAFDVWGDTVNTTSRIESAGFPGQISVSSATYSRTKRFFPYLDRGEVFTKDQRWIHIYTTDRLGTGDDPFRAADFEQKYNLDFNKALVTAPWSIAQIT